MRKSIAIRRLDRQLQLIGKMLRQRDVEPIRQALDKLKNRHNQQVVLFHKLENLRDRLIDQGDDAIAEVLNLWPDADRQQLRTLIRNAKKEKEGNTWRCLCFGSALQITRMTPSRLTILQLRHNFLTEARTFIFTLRNFSGDQLSAVAFQVRLLQCRLILTGHHQSLHLSHKVHNHDNNDKQ